MIDKIKEDLFYKEEFSFSYSSLNRLLFSPKLFYRDYILKERELKMEKHLIEGRLIHLLLLEPDRFDEEFRVVPTRIPSDSLRKVLYDISQHTDLTELSIVDDKIILQSLKNVGLYQSLKDESKRIAKVRTTECEDYYGFKTNSRGLEVIDNDMLTRATERVDIIKSNKDVMALLMEQGTDWDLDHIQVYNEKKLNCDLNDYKFGLKGIIDKYIIDDESKTITIVDLKTTAKPLENFAETVDFYNYWLQAAIYSLLVIKNVDENQQDYKIIFKFVAIDKYDQVYAFPVSESTLLRWMNELNRALKLANYHYSERKYDLPYEFANGNVIL